MLLSELLQTVEKRVAIPPSRAHALKTAVQRYLIPALQQTPTASPEVEALQSTYKPLLHAYFARLSPQPSPRTRRNMLNSLSWLFRTARACGLLQTDGPKLPSPPPRRIKAVIAEASKSAPYRTRLGPTLSRYTCQPDAWPPVIQQRWGVYRQERAYEVRQVTLKHYEAMLSSYLGFYRNVEHTPLETWEHFFAPTHAERFIRWHAKRVGAPRITQLGISVLNVLITLAKQDHRPELPALEALRQKQPTPLAMHNKQAPMHTFELPELDAVGLSLLAEGRAPLISSSSGTKRPGLQRAVRYQLGLILRLLIRVPMRSRCIQTMVLDKHLSKDGKERWWIDFKGDELKVAERGGKINTFHLAFPPELVDDLEEFLARFRPILSDGGADPHVFLTFARKPFTGMVLRKAIFDQVWSFTGKRFYPHLVRTLWQDRYLLDSNGDVSTSAFMLNDHPLTALGRYHELRGTQHVPKAFAFNHTLFGTPFASHKGDV
jgi:hypothetical protein